MRGGKEKEAQVWVAVLERTPDTESVSTGRPNPPNIPSIYRTLHTAQSYCANDSESHMFQNPAANPHLSLTSARFKNTNVTAITQRAPS